MKKLFAGLVLAFLCLSGARQASAQANVGGLLYAAQFGTWTVPQGTNGPYAWSSPAFCQISANAVTFAAFTVGTPIRIVDANPALDETVVPSAVLSNGFGCSITINPAYQHNSFHFASATGGLQEAINYAIAKNSPAVVVLTTDWSSVGGTTTIIGQVTGKTSISISDQRTSYPNPYSWNGSKYVLQPIGSPGSLPSGTGIVAVNSGTGALATQAQISTGLAAGANAQIGAPGAVGDGTTDDTTALQAAITNNRYLVLASGKTYLISAALTIPCGVGTTIDFNHSTVTLANAANSNMLRADCANGDGTHIVLLHGIMQGNGGNQTPNHTSPIWGTGYFGLIDEFTQVDSLYMQDWQIINSTTWGIGLTLCGDTVFKDFYFDNASNSVDIGGIQGSARNIYIDHVWGYQPDDVLGFSSGKETFSGHDIGVPNASNIDIQNLVIKNVDMLPNDANTQYSFGIGIYPTNGHTIHNLDIENISGVFADHVLRVYDYWPTAGVNDFIDNVHLANIQATLGTPAGITSSIKIPDVSIPYRIQVGTSTTSYARPGITFAPAHLAALIPLNSGAFVGVPLAALSTILPDTGGAWSTVNGSWALDSSEGFLQQNTTITTGVCQGCAITTIPLDTATRDDYTITSLMETTNASYEPGIIFRYQDANNFWLAQMEPTELALYEVVAGASTLMASTPGTLSTFSPYTLSVTVVDGSILAMETSSGGTLSVPVTTSDFLTATSVGVKSNDPSAKIFTFQASYQYTTEPGFYVGNNALLSANNVFTGNNAISNAGAYARLDFTNTSAGGKEWSWLDIGADGSHGGVGCYTLYDSTDSVQVETFCNNSVTSLVPVTAPTLTATTSVTTPIVIGSDPIAFTLDGTLAGTVRCASGAHCTASSGIISFTYSNGAGDIVGTFGNLLPYAANCVFGVANSTAVGFNSYLTLTSASAFTMAFTGTLVASSVYNWSYVCGN
jgi:hypothetical protein